MCFRDLSGGVIFLFFLFSFFFSCSLSEFRYFSVSVLEGVVKIDQAWVFHSDRMGDSAFDGPGRKKKDRKATETDGMLEEGSVMVYQQYWIGCLGCAGLFSVFLQVGDTFTDISGGRSSSWFGSSWRSLMKSRQAGREGCAVWPAMGSRLCKHKQERREEERRGEERREDVPVTTYRCHILFSVISFTS